MLVVEKSAIFFYWLLNFQRPVLYSCLNHMSIFQYRKRAIWQRSECSDSVAVIHIVHVTLLYIGQLNFRSQFQIHSVCSCMKWPPCLTAYVWRFYKPNERTVPWFNYILLQKIVYFFCFCCYRCCCSGCCCF